MTKAVAVQCSPVAGVKPSFPLGDHLTHGPPIPLRLVLLAVLAMPGCVGGAPGSY